MKCNMLCDELDELASRPARGGWIEIDKLFKSSLGGNVPPRTGRVD